MLTVHISKHYLNLLVFCLKLTGSSHNKSVFLTVVRKCTLTENLMLPCGESRCVWWWDRHTDRQTQGRKIVTLCFPLDAASIVILWSQQFSSFYFHSWK